MRKNLMVISVLFILISFHMNNSINEEEQNPYTINNRKLKKIIRNYINNYLNDKNENKTKDDDDDDKGEDKKDRQDQNYNNDTAFKPDDLEDLDNKIVVLGIVAILLFIIIIVYSSIKCYILCTKKHDSEYRVSNISMNKLGEEYMDDTYEEKKSRIMEKNGDDFGAPLSAKDSKSSRIKGNTFNPDNYVPPNEDKNLYKPYHNEEI